MREVFRYARASGLLCLVATHAWAGPVRTTTAEPHDGIVREQWVDAAIPAKLELILIDLTSSEISMKATPEASKGKTTTAAANLPGMGSAVAINGDAFAVAGYRPRGLAMGDSMTWSQTADDSATAVLHLRRTGERTTVAIVPPETPVTPPDLPLGTQGVVSGRPLLVREGNVESGFDCADPVTVACVRAPRSAVGITADGNTLLVVAVDGWQDGSIGMTAAELATFLHARGARTAMMLDSGSSSTLVLDGAVVNHPSDGIERTVANHLAFKYGALSKGQLYGLICKEDVIACSVAGSPLRISGARVTLDDGRVLTSNAADCPNGRLCGSFSFTGVTPRLACVTVKQPGYLTKSKCAQVPEGGIGYASVGLFAGMDMVDAGVPDAAEIVGDAPDGGGGGDAGPSLMGDAGGGCCHVGGARPPIGATVLVLVGWFLGCGPGRRRGTRPR